MTKYLPFIFIIFNSLFLFSCSSTENKPASDISLTDIDEFASESENEDGAYEALMMEYEMTRDPKLGYVPRTRLVRAYENLVQLRKSNVNSRLNALNWIERGPSSDVVGVNNGNTRGPGNNAVTAGRIRAIHLDLADASKKTVWVGSVSGGLWKTNDINASPANWILVNDFLGNLAIASICQNPANPQIMYFATGERNGNIDAVRGGGIWKSENNGASWNLLSNTINFWNASKIVCDAAGNVYVGTAGNNQGLLRSTNGGESWQSITPANASNSTRITDIKLSSTGRLHVTMSGSGGAGSYFTDNPSSVNASSWQSPTTAIPSLTANCEIAVAGDILYALPEGAGGLTPQVYKSTDGGVNWIATATSPPSATAEPTINAGQGWFDLAIGVDPSNPNIVIAGGLNFYKSVDGGATWAQITRWVGTTNNYVHADHHGVFWNGTQVMVATDGGVFLSNDNGTTFVDKNVGLRIKQFYSCAIHPTNFNYFLGGTQDNGSHALNNPGLGGSVEVHGGDGGYTHIDEDEPQYQFSAVTRNQYRRSVNNGSNWGSVNFSGTIGQFINPTDYDDVNNLLYCSGNSGTYVRWENPQTGSTFSTVSITSATPNSVRSFKVSNYTPNRVFMGTAGGAVVRVDNAHVSAATAVNITDAAMPQANGNIISSVNTGSSDNFLIATYSNYGLPHVWYSVNGGTNWVNIQGNLPDIPVRWAMFHPDDNDKAIIATEMGVYETDNLNGAATVWVQNASFPVVKTNMLQYRFSDRTILAATHGRGLWTAGLPATNPNIRFASSYTYGKPFTESTAGTDGCRNYRDVTLNMMIDAPPAGTANVQLNISGGTATEGVDFDITTNGNFVTPSKMIQFANGSTAPQQISIRIYDDVVVESAESVVISYSVGGGTNAVPAINSTSYTIQIADNDNAPLPSTPANIMVGNGNYGGYVQPFRGQFAKARSQYIYRADELTAAGITAGAISSIAFNVTSKASTAPYNSLNISLKNTSLTQLSGTFETGLTTVYSVGAYSTVLGTNTFTFNQNSFTWDGISNIVVEICFDNTSGTNNDNVASNTTTYQSGLWGRENAATTSGCQLDGTVTTLFGAVGTNNDRVRPEILFGVTVVTNIETILNRTKTNFIAGTGTAYFFSQGFGNLMNSVSNATATLGCVTFTVQEAGNVWQNYFAGQRSQKVFNVELSANSTATYTIGLYVTASELGGKTPAQINIAQTSSATVAGANSSNTTIAATTVTGFGAGYVFTATVAGGGRFFLTDAVITSVTNVTGSNESFVKLQQNPVGSSIYLTISNEQRQTITANIYSATGQLIRSWSLGKAAGLTELSLNGTALSAGTYILKVNSEKKSQSIKLVKR